MLSRSKASFRCRFPFFLDNIYLPISQTYYDYCCLIRRLDRFGSASVTAVRDFKFDRNISFIFPNNNIISSHRQLIYPLSISCLITICFFCKDSWFWFTCKLVLLPLVWAIVTPYLGEYVICPSAEWTYPKLCYQLRSFIQLITISVLNRIIQWIGTPSVGQFKVELSANNREEREPLNGTAQANSQTSER